MALLPKVSILPSLNLFGPLYRQQITPLTSSAILLHKKKRYPKPRKPERRNLEGEALEEHLTRRTITKARREEYLVAVRTVLQRWREEEAQKVVDEKQRVIDNLFPPIDDRKVREQRQRNREILEEHNRKQAERRATTWTASQAAKAAERSGKRQEKLDATRERNTELVLQMIEESKNFLTLEKLDEQIDNILDNETNFNYAVTMEGDKIHSTKPPGNLDNWKGASPVAYALGGLGPGTKEFEEAFEGKGLGSYLRRGGLFKKAKN